MKTPLSKTPLSKMPSVKAQLAACLEQLEVLFQERFTRHEGICLEHGTDETFYQSMAPDAVVFPHSTQEVARAVSICAAHKVPIIPYGTGTSLEGHILAVEGGVCLDLSQMNQILRVSTEDMDCTVQAGVTRKQLNQHLRETGLMFPIDPGADASLGGMTATRASGTNAVRYGTMRENVLAVKAVMANGEVIDTATRARKSSAGYDLTRLLVGSEGTLGIIVEVTLRLHGIPEAAAAGICSFQTLAGAVDSVITTIQSGLPVARIELLDEAQVDIINRFNGLNYPVLPTLWLEFHGSESSVAEQQAWFGSIAEENGGDILEWTTQSEQRNALWDIRHQAWSACHAAAPGKSAWSTDVCVPISQLTECILAAKQAISASSLQCSIIGHVGDGNFHTVIMVDRDNPADINEAQRLNAAIVAKAQQLGGTCTGEHGIGLGKIDKLENELPGAVAIMGMIKQSLDPDNILNPGKVIRLALDDK